MRTNRFMAIASLTMIFVLGGCSLPGRQVIPTQPSLGDSVATSIALTLTAFSSLAGPTVAQTPGNQSTPFPTNTRAVTSTPPPPSSPFPTITSRLPTANPIPCDQAQFVMDVTILDNTNFAPNTTFTKTWRLQNNGTCTWTSAYALVFDSGNALNGPAEVALPGAVAPGQTIDLSVNLKSPASAGSYQGFWKLRNASGARFGIGTNATSSFWVKITVGNTATPGPSPTSGSVIGGSCLILETGPSYAAEYPPNASFDTRWKVKNISSSSWTVGTVDFKYLGGTKFYEHESIYDLKAQVDPDGTIDLILDSIAPASPGLYTMSWGLVQGNTALCSMSATIRVK
ncbi:MAG: hypothetical protein IT308_10330 [Anaerolineaceae bacterium]|nr:hypothetical protein [Anaerolineaceae bacterium]